MSSVWKKFRTPSGKTSATRLKTPVKLFDPHDLKQFLGDINKMAKQHGQIEKNYSTSLKDFEKQHRQ